MTRVESSQETAERDSSRVRVTKNRDSSRAIDSSHDITAKETFFSKLIDSEISDEDYEHAQKVWKQFEMKTFREYHDLYRKADVLLLADVF